MSFGHDSSLAPQMQFGKHMHSSRSKLELNDPTAVLGSASPSTGGSAGADEVNSSRPRSINHHQPHTLGQDPRDDSHPYIPQNPLSNFEPRPSYRNSGEIPRRSVSTRQYSPHHQYSQASLSPAASSTDDLALKTRQLQTQGRRDSGTPPQQQQQQQQQPLSPTVEPKKERRSFFPFKKSSNKAQDPSSQPSHSSGLARRLSRKDPPPIQPVQQVESSKQQHHLNWQTGGGGSRSYLPSPLEAAEDASGLDPYLISEPEEGRYHNIQDQGRNSSIRPVPGEADPTHHSGDSEALSLYHTHQQQQYSQGSFDGHSADPPQQNRYHSQNSTYSQQLKSPPGRLAANETVRQPQNPETISQTSYESPTQQQREDQPPISVQSNGHSPTIVQNLRLECQDRSPSQQQPIPRSSPQQAIMPPVQQRRSTDPKQGQQEARENTPGYQEQYTRNQPPTPGLSPHPSTVGSQGQNYRGGPPQREQFPSSGQQGRNTPPPGPSDMNDAYKELSQKYKKVKGLYFEKTAQVEQLQNTLANQRLSQSRTSLDDSEYMTRFQRLDGAITNLAFNIRKDWRTVPNWIASSVNQDAVKIGKQEMTAVGRACITKFVVDEIFNKSFHPALKPELSTNLKAIERNIRRFSPALNNQEESDALISKVIQWRLTTLEGLKDSFSNPESEEYRKQFSQIATSKLSAYIINYLQDPAPGGVEDTAHMIVELAVGILANLPLESREISISYPMPGDIVQSSHMKTEDKVPPLDNPGAETLSEVDSKSTTSGVSVERDDEKVDPKARKEKTMSGMLQGLMGSGAIARKGSVATVSGAEEKNKPHDDGPQKVRFAGFVGVEVRGRQVLCKAPVWTLT